jgi:hypothetical protein
MFNKQKRSTKMNIEQLKHNLNTIQKQICSMIEHPEQITIKNVQQLKLPIEINNDDLINKLTKYSNDSYHKSLL